MILRIGLDAGVPGHFFAKDHFAIHQRGAFAIACAQIETNAAAFQMAAERCGYFFFRWSVLEGGGLDGEWKAVHALTNELPVEGARSAGCVNAAQVIGDMRIPGDSYQVSAFLPKQKLQ